MTPTLQELGIDRLNVEDRIALAQAIWNSIAPHVDGSLMTKSQRLELAQRLADHQQNPNDVVPWEQVKTEALARWQRRA